VTGQRLVPIESRHVLVPIDIVTTPGARADLFQVIQTLPGVAKVDDGAGVFVRGGDVSELQTLLDGAVMFHPYKYETPTGGIFGAVEPFLTKGMSFSTGAFSARIGNALSGVLELEGLDRPATSHVAATAGLAAVSWNVSRPLGGRSGVRVSGNHSFTKLLFKVNRETRNFPNYPDSLDVNGTVHYAPNCCGTLKAFVMYQRDGVGVDAEAEAFRGVLNSTSTTSMVSLNWRHTLSPEWRASAAYGDSGYRQHSGLGVLDLHDDERRRSWRVDTEWARGRNSLRLGGSGEFSFWQYRGIAPLRGADFNGVSGTTAFVVDHGDWYGGPYAEVERRQGRFTSTVGLRVDHYSNADDFTLDPRVNVVVRLNEAYRLRLGVGRFHQSPAAGYFDSIRGAQQLLALSADHYVAGFERGSENGAFQVRAEGYYKAYRHLPLEDAAHGYTSEGYGSASGIDVFARARRSIAMVRASYSYLHSRRRWTPTAETGQFEIPEEGTWRPDFDIPQTLNILSQVTLPKAVMLSGSWRLASGRPYTPVLGATPLESGYEPVHGAINSQRLPRYERVDLSASRSTSWRRTGLLTMFVGLNNLLGRPNYFQYVYSPDFAERKPERPATPRTIYFGISIVK